VPLNGCRVRPVSRARAYHLSRASGLTKYLQFQYRLMCYKLKHETAAKPPRPPLEPYAKQRASFAFLDSPPHQRVQVSVSQLRG
jgi:hypothetical protein